MPRWWPPACRSPRSRRRCATLLARLGDARARPLLAGDPGARLRALARERAPVYEAVATLGVDTERRTPGQVAAHIAARLHELGALA